MPDFSLVPVDHQPDFGDVSFVPVDHDPFSAVGMIEQARTQLESQPQRLAAAAGLPDVEKPAVDWSRNNQPFGELKAATYTPTQHIGNFVAGALMGLGIQPYTANDLTSRVGNVVAASPLGVAGSALDLIDAKRRDDLRGAAIAAAGMIPGAKGIARGVAEEAGAMVGVGGRRVGTVPAEASALRGGSDSLASRSASIYDPPEKSPRPFEADYPSGASSDVAGNLTRDIDGRNLTARSVVGRRTLGAADEALTPAQLDTAATATLGSPIESRPASALPRGSVGAYRVTRGPDGPERGITVLGSLVPATKNKVVAHEFGHAIDDLAGEIDTEPLMAELRRVYNTLNNPSRATTPGTGRYGPQTGEAARGRPYTPEDAGYRGKNVSREYIAEAIRAYIADPNYLKTVAPKTAATIRKFVNDNPRLNKVIQFNSVAVPVGIDATNGDSNDDR